MPYREPPDEPVVLPYRVRQEFGNHAAMLAAALATGCPRPVCLSFGYGQNRHASRIRAAQRKLRHFIINLLTFHPAAVELVKKVDYTDQYIP
jgi:hypothetical protein